MRQADQNRTASVFYPGANEEILCRDESDRR